MPHPLDFNIREQLARYLASEISLHEFEDWFFPETWNIDQTDDLNLLNLVYGIKLRLAEFSNGDWTEDELHSRLRPFTEQYMTNASHTQIQYGTSNINIRVQPSITNSVVQSVDIRFSTVYV